MGHDKALLPWGNTTLLGHAIAQVRAAGCDHIRVSGRPDHPLGVEDAEPGRGPARAVTRLLQTLETSARFALVMPVDMPLLTAPDLARLAGADGGACFAGHPLPLVLEIDRVRALTASPERLRDLAAMCGTLQLETAPDLDARLVNLNHPEDYEAALAQP